MYCEDTFLSHNPRIYVWRKYRDWEFRQVMFI